MMRRILILVAGSLLVGCPTYEDEYTGRYQELIPTVEDPSGESLPDEAVVVDLFRYGKFVQAIIRFHETGERENQNNPFAEETTCVWTESAELEEDNSFSLEFADARFGKEATLSGRIEGAVIEARIVSGTDKRDFSMQRQPGAEPEPVCDPILDFPMEMDFDFENNRLPEDTYEMRRPVWGVLWTAVEVVEREGGARVYVPLNELPMKTWYWVDSVNRTDDGNGFQNTIVFLLQPPEETIRTFSGSTRYAIGHPLVIDDDGEDPDDRFRWNWNDEPVEPIVATALTEGERLDVSVDHDTWGQAILFVEGDVRDLDSRILNRMSIEGSEESIEKLQNPRAHFYVVDVFSENEQIEEIRFPPTPHRSNEVRVKVTDAYLRSTSIRLPRLFP